MRIIYQKEILREFEKQQKERVLKEYEEELMEESLKNVYPEVVDGETLVRDFKEEKASSDVTPRSSPKSPDLFRSDLWTMNEDYDETDYEMMIAHRRLKFKMSRQYIKERKQRLRMLLQGSPK